jgi:hypothetical protein
MRDAHARQAAIVAPVVPSRTRERRGAITATSMGRSLPSHHDPREECQRSPEIIAICRTCSP